MQILNIHCTPEYLLVQDHYYKNLSFEHDKEDGITGGPVKVQILSGRAVKFNEGMPSPYTAHGEFERFSSLEVIDFNYKLASLPVIKELYTKRGIGQFWRLIGTIQRGFLYGYPSGMAHNWANKRNALSL